MSSDNLPALIRQLTSADAAEREAARNALLALDEDAVDPLIAEFHAGVSDAMGAAIIDVVGEIGGPDALTLLRYVFHFEEHRPLCHAAAIKALRYNAHSLDQSERDALPPDA